MDKLTINYTLKEFQEMECFKPSTPFKNIIIVPMDEIHDSGFRCMKFVLEDKNCDICGVIYTGSDVVWPNGIGGYGRDWTLKYGANLVPKLGLHFDCLPKSGCVRIITDCECTLDDFIGSDFMFYGEESN